MDQLCFFPWRDKPWLPFHWINLFVFEKVKLGNKDFLRWEITNERTQCQQILKEMSIAEWKSAGGVFATQLWNAWCQSTHLEPTWRVCVLSKETHWNAYWSGFFLAIDALPRETNVLDRPSKRPYLQLYIKNPQISKEEWREEKIWSDATIWVRTVQDCPSNERNPETLSKIITTSCKKLPGVKIKAHSSHDEFLKNWGGLQGIHQGAQHEHPAFLIIGDYTPSKKSNRQTVLVGKGVNFDTGGMALKNPEKMSLMKMDLTGALCAFAIFYTSAFLQKSHKLSIVLPLVDNIVGSHAILPGSVVKLYGGTTVEIVDPDAEGRVILAEASNYANEHYPNYDAIVMGTLTGQIDKVGNGLYSALFRKGNTENKWLYAAEESQELVWDCPLQKAFEPLIHSTVADYVNSNEDITADMLWCGYFLSKFWNQKTDWSYIDLTGIISTPFQIPWIPKIGHGIGVQLVRHYMENK